MTWDLFAWSLVVVMLQKVVQFLVLLGATQTCCVLADMKTHENTISYSRATGWSLSDIKCRMPPVTTTSLANV